jgi:hypothetical protein
MDRPPLLGLHPDRGQSTGFVCMSEEKFIKLKGIKICLHNNTKVHVA